MGLLFYWISWLRRSFIVDLTDFELRRSWAWLPCPPSGIEVRDELSSLTIHIQSSYFPGWGRESKTIRILAHWTSIRILNLFLVPEPISSEKRSWLALAHYFKWEKKLTLPKTSGNFVPGLIFKLRIRISLSSLHSTQDLLFPWCSIPLSFRSTATKWIAIACYICCWESFSSLDELG